MEPSSPNRYIQGMTPYFELLKHLTLPPRGKKGSRANKLRAKMMLAALHQTKYPRGIGCPIRKAKHYCGLCRVKVLRG